MTAILIDQYDTTRVHAVTATLVSGTAAPNANGTWSWTVTNGTLGFTGTGTNRAEAVDAMISQMLA